MNPKVDSGTPAGQNAKGRPPPRPLYLENTSEIRRRISVYYLIHPGARLAVRIGFLAAVGLFVFAVLDWAGYLKPSYASPAYYAAVAAIGLGVTIVSVWGIRGRFTGLVVPDDPGHWNLPYVPEGVDPTRGFGRVRIPESSIPGTYPPDSPGDSVRRIALQWTYPPGQSKSLRVLQLKFGAIAVHASGRDAKEARAYARVRINHGAGGSVSPHGWRSIGQLNWYLEGWDERLESDERSPDGALAQPLLNFVYEYPNLGFNKYLHNPEVTILRDQSHYLPLFYMREGQPDVFLCGQLQAQLVGMSPDEAPVDFDLEVTVGALNFRPQKLKIHCTAKWAVLTVGMGSW